MKKNNKEIFLADIPTPNGERNKQGYKVYSSNGTSVSITKIKQKANPFRGWMNA